jgi:hypothetical protein
MWMLYFLPSTNVVSKGNTGSGRMPMTRCGSREGAACPRRRAVLGILLAMLSVPPARAQALPPARDPSVAIAEELAAALADGSNRRLVLFIARHPRSAQAGTARRMLAARAAPDSGPGVGPDAAIAAEFDAARLAGAAALRDFAARHPGHPLAAEALAPFWMER